MNFRFLTSWLWTLSLAWTSSAFLRTAPDISPFEYDYVKFAGVNNITDVITYNSTGIKSYWWANFIKGDDGHDYCIVITGANAGATGLVSSLAITDITANTHFGVSYYTTGQLSDTEFAGQSNVLTYGSHAADQISENWVVSNLTEFPFNLSYVAKGPNFYQGGSGSFKWGTQTAYAIDLPETYVTGTFSSNGKEVTVVPEESMAWFDFQWGPGYAVGGWQDFVVLLDNGVKIQVTITAPDPHYDQASYATIMYPDGFHSVWPVQNDTLRSNPWVSPATNLTYYQDYHINIPSRQTSLDVHLPVQGGETAPTQGATAANTIADTFAIFSGTFEGLPARGWGIMELRHSADAEGCAVFGC